MKICGILLSTVVLCHLSAVKCNDAVRTEDAYNAAVQGINTFSKSLYQVLRDEPGNLVVSPFSVEVVLAMLSTGLRGDTAKHISAALYLPDDRSKVEEGFKAVLNRIQNSGNVTVEIANKIYIQKDFKIKDAFRQSTESYFHSASEEVDIAGNTEAVRLAVNAWAAEKTHNKIQNLLQEGTLSPNSILLLLNAIYFKGLWANSFDKKSTRDGIFHLSSTSDKNVPMMHLTAELQHAHYKDQKFQVLKLPYSGGRYSMVILLPDEVDGLQQLESTLDTLDFSPLLNRVWNTKIVLMLPRFEILNTIDLEAPLKKLGLGELFNGGDFSGISDGGLAVSKALQKAYIKVDEEGTEAAAVTVIQLTRTAKVVLPQREFTVDHPFMYMIVEEEKNTILFMGRVVDPPK